MAQERVRLLSWAFVVLKIPPLVLLTEDSLEQKKTGMFKNTKTGYFNKTKFAIKYIWVQEPIGER